MRSFKEWLRKIFTMGCKYRVNIPQWDGVYCTNPKCPTKECTEEIRKKCEWRDT